MHSAAHTLLAFSARAGIEYIFTNLGSDHPAFIEAFAEISGVPVLLNTSFNENEPIVDTPEQALDCFFRTRMDAIVVNDTLVRRHPTP